MSAPDNEVARLYPDLANDRTRRYRGLRQAAAVGLAYRWEMAAGTPHPIAAIARKTGLSRQTVAMMVGRARRAGFVDGPLHSLPPEAEASPERLPLLRSPKHETEAQRQRRFWSNVAKGGPEDCWPWRGHVNDQGYGVFHLAGHYVNAHRMAFTYHHGRPPLPGLLIRHRCHNRPCCNPAHLREGTHQDNGADLREKNGHHRCPACGEWCSGGYAKPSNAL